MTRKILINLSITIILILFIFWLRLLRIRIPINIYEITYTTSTIIITIIIIILSLYSIFKRDIRGIKIKPTLFTIYPLKNLIKFIIQILDTPRELYNQIDDNKFPFPFLYKKLIDYIILRWNYPRFWELFFDFIPQIIVSTIFMVDIFWFHQLNYFFKSLVLLLLPLIWRYYMYIVLFSNIQSKEYWLQYLDVSILSNNTYYLRLKQKAPNIPNAWPFPKMKENYIYIMDEWSAAMERIKFGNRCGKISEKYKPYLYLYLYSGLLYLTGYGYILYYNLITIY